MKITFVLKEPQEDVAVKNQIETPIYLLCRYGNNRARIRTKESVLPKWWETSTYSLKARAPERSRINEVLADLKKITDNEFADFQKQNQRPPTPKELKSIVEDVYFNPKEEIKDDDTFFGFIDWFIDYKERKNEVTQRRLWKYKVSRNKLKAFQEKTGYVLTFNRIDENFSLMYQEFLQNEYNHKRNTINTEFKILKAFLNKALTKGKHSNLAYKDADFTPKEIETDEVMLSIEQLNELYELDLKTKPHLECVRDLFLIACWTGLRFSDATRISKRFVKGNEIILPMKKSGRRKTKVRIPIEHPHLVYLLEKYDYKAPTTISNQKTNDALKIICEMLPSLQETFVQDNILAGVNIQTEKPIYQLVTFHSARRSFCSIMYQIGVPTLSIMAISGHKTEKEFLKYIRVPDTDHAKRMASIQANYFTEHTEKVRELNKII